MDISAFAPMLHRVAMFLPIKDWAIHLARSHPQIGECILSKHNAIWKYMWKVAYGHTGERLCYKKAVINKWGRIYQYAKSTTKETCADYGTDWGAKYGHENRNMHSWCEYCKNGGRLPLEVGFWIGRYAPLRYGSQAIIDDTASMKIRHELQLKKLLERQEKQKKARAVLIKNRNNRCDAFELKYRDYDFYLKFNNNNNN